MTRLQRLLKYRAWLEDEQQKMLDNNIAETAPIFALQVNFYENAILKANEDIRVRKEIDKVCNKIEGVE